MVTLILISPVLDGQRVSTILPSNRVNDVITILQRFKSKWSFTDPTACQYISKEIVLKILQLLKIILDAHINDYSGIRLSTR